MDKIKSYRTARGYELKNNTENSLTSSMEDYLEMIFRLSCENKVVHVSQISEKLQVKPSSVSKMNRRLKELDLIKGGFAEGIHLTETGREKAKYLLYRHDIIESFLMFLDSNDPLSETERLEHTISESTVEHIRILQEFFELNPKVSNLFCEFKSQLHKNQLNIIIDP